MIMNSFATNDKPIKSKLHEVLESNKKCSMFYTQIQKNCRVLFVVFLLFYFLRIACKILDNTKKKFKNSYV